MKKLVILVLNVLLLITLCGCSSRVYTIEKDGKTYEVNHDTETIYDGTYTYEFSYSADPDASYIEIVYPNGATYSESYGDGAGLVSGSEAFDEEGYIIGNKEYESAYYLCELIMHKDSLEIPAGKFWGVVILFGLGIFFIAAPRKVWDLRHGWIYQNSEPTDVALGFIVFGGIVSIVFGIVVIFI